jgi:drug/metabolite transporter (DMT)-like permease
VSFARLRAADWLAFVAALALIFTTAADWYSTQSGDEARRIQELAQPSEGEVVGQTEREVQEDAAALAEGEERNAWQPTATIDVLILIALLATAALAVLAAFARASGRRDEPLDATALAGLAAAGTALLVVYRGLQEPGLDDATTVKAGAPLALLVLGVIAFACATSVRADDVEGERAEPAAATPTS